MARPTEITAEILAKYSDIDDGLIAQDIAETEREIALMTIMVAGLEAEANLNTGLPSGKMAAFMAEAKQQGINDRRGFVDFLKALQSARGEMARRYHS